jgi:hypothetical protein
MLALTLALTLEASPLTILWPRIIPSAQAERSGELAKAMQLRVLAAAHRVLPDRVKDTRPKSERSCPDAGCEGGSVGVLLLRDGDGCAAVALVGVPGRGRVRLASWVGAVEIKKYEVEFREPPESSVKVKDFVKCTDLIALMDKPSVDVDRAIADMLK